MANDKDKIVKERPPFKVMEEYESIFKSNYKKSLLIMLANIFDELKEK